LGQSTLADVEQSFGGTTITEHGNLIFFRNAENHQLDYTASYSLRLRS